MANIPSNLSYGTVTGRFILAYADSADSGLEPDAIPAAGSVFFTASPIFIKDATANPAAVTVLPAVAEATLDEDGYISAYAGTLGIVLLATDDPQGNPVDWTWRADFRLTDQAGTPIAIPSFSFSLPSGSTVDLTSLAPVPAANGTFYITGPRGTDFVVRGTVASEANLPATGNVDNQGYITEDTGHLWIWLQDDAEWFDNGEFRGPGVAPGGTTGDFLIKSGSGDYATAWTNTINGGSA